jgi:hypothetical protein
VIDQQILIEAIEEAQCPFSPNIEAGSALGLPDVSINRLLSVRDRRDVVSALNRLKAGYGLRVVK